MLMCQSKVTGQRVCVTQNRIVLLFSHSHFRERPGPGEGKCHTGVSAQGSSLGFTAVGPCADAWDVPGICLLSGYRKGLWRGKLGITGT